MKDCEFCGDSSSDYFYRFIAEVKKLIFLKNSSIVENNTRDRYVILHDGSRVDYSIQSDPDHAVEFIDLIPHIFCSELCEDRLLKKYAQYLSGNIHNRHTLINYEKEELFAPHILPVEMIEHTEINCRYCQSLFPNYQKYYTVQDIASYREISGSLAEQKLLDNKIQLEPHEILISDISIENTEGLYFIYKTGLEKDRYPFCSNECCFEHCLKTNSIAFFKSNIEKGYTLAITKDIININKALKQVYKYKPLEYVKY